MLGFSLVLLRPETWLQNACLGVAKMAYGMQTTETLILQLDAEYFGSDGIATSSTVMFTGAYIRAIGGVAFASFLSTYTTTLFYVICSSLQVGLGVVLAMTGVQY